MRLKTLCIGSIFALALFSCGGTEGDGDNGTADPYEGHIIVGNWFTEDFPGMGRVNIVYSADATVKVFVSPTLEGTFSLDEDAGTITYSGDVTIFFYHIDGYFNYSFDTSGEVPVLTLTGPGNYHTETKYYLP